MRGIVTLSVVMLGCGGKGGGGCNGSPVLELGEENNYSYTGLLDIGTIEVKPLTDLTIDWSGVTTDIRGRELDPTTVQQVAILGVGSPLDETVALIETNRLDATQDAYLLDNEGGTSALTSQLSVLTNYLLPDPLLKDDPNTTWLVSLLNVDDGRTDLLMSAHFAPTEGSENTTVALTSDSAALDVDVDLHSAPPLTARAGDGAYTVDWTSVKKDVYGNEFLPVLGDEMIIGRYDTEDIGEIEAGFLQLDANAAELYRVDVYGLTGVDLDPDGPTPAVDADGNAFTGFTTDGTWLVGILCTTCITPVPLLLSIVDVE